jgi:hypothetical protein
MKILIMNSRKYISLAIAAVALNGVTVSVFAHEAGAPFSGAIIDPLVLHHAHIENEQRFNFFSSFGVQDGTGRKRTAYEGEFELAYASPNFRYGAELFIPVANIPSPNSSGRETGIGDIEFRPLKLALYNSPEFILSTATAFRAPTGSESKGLGGGEWGGTQFLFADFARGNWFLGVNLGLETSLTGPRETGLEYGVACAYSFIHDTTPGGLAAPEPRQTWVISPSLEVVGTRGFQGAAAGEDTLSLIPGLTFWHTHSGWQIHVGVAAPVSGQRESDATLLIQIGNHFNWGRLFGRGKTN